MQIGSSLEVLTTTMLTGGIAVFPTDTVYGIGCRIDAERSVNRIYEIKQRAINQPLPILLPDPEAIHEYAPELPAIAMKLISRFWPGSLTIVVSVRPESVLPIFLNGQGRASFRVPNHDPLRGVIRQVGIPLVGTSANIHGSPPVKNANRLDPKLTEQVDYVYEGSAGLGIESTVVEITPQGMSILREAGIRQFELEQVVQS